MTEQSGDEGGWGNSGMGQSFHPFELVMEVTAGAQKGEHEYDSAGKKKLRTVFNQTALFPLPPTHLC